MQNSLLKDMNPRELFNLSSLPISKLVTPTNPNLASEFYKKLIKLIDDFDRNLDQNHEVGVKLVSFGPALVFHLKGLGYWNPSLITFSGFTEQGNLLS
jgi:Family of unknown function (DUF6173)